MRLREGTGLCLVAYGREVVCHSVRWIGAKVGLAEFLGPPADVGHVVLQGSRRVAVRYPMFDQRSNVFGS